MNGKAEPSNVQLSTEAPAPGPRRLGLLRRVFTDVDWMGISFEALKDCGEDIDMTCGYVPDPASPVQWHHLSHARFDGLSGFVDLLSRLGWDVETAPSRRPGKSKRLGLLERYRAMKAYGKYARLGPAPWKDFDWEAVGPSCGIAWEVFSVEETRRLERAARRARSTMADTLLWTINEVVSDLVVDPDAARTWVVPINMRGQLGRPSRVGNQFSFVGVQLAPGMEPRELHKSIYAMLRANVHRGAWWTFRLAGILRGPAIYRQLYLHTLARRQSWMGSVSFLGTWPPGAAPDVSGQGDMFFGAAVVNRFNPIGAAGLTWKGKLGLGLQFHPGLTRDLRTVEEYKNRWAEKLRTFPEGAGDRAPD